MTDFLQFPVDSTLLLALNTVGYRTQRRIPASSISPNLSFIIKATVCSLGMTRHQLPVDLSCGKSFFFLSYLNSAVGEGTQLPIAGSTDGAGGDRNLL